MCCLATKALAVCLKLTLASWLSVLSSLPAFLMNFLRLRSFRQRSTPKIKNWPKVEWKIRVYRPIVLPGSIELGMESGQLTIILTKHLPCRSSVDKRVFKIKRFRTNHPLQMNSGIILTSLLAFSCYEVVAQVPGALDQVDSTQQR